MRVIATAGHVDHGKSSLVLALTGTDPDRWEEEKRRGLTIDLGFAFTTLASGDVVSFVDVPGHIRFLRNMLAGVGGVDACLFVVAANEGWKPQTEEHLRILNLLGIAHGIVVVTKIDLVDQSTLDATMADIAVHVRSTFLQHAPVIPVSVTSGVGLDALRASLQEIVSLPKRTIPRQRPRLWIDRVFAIKGSGTVVTGTLTDGSLHVGDDLVAFPNRQPVRVRSIQTHGRSVDELEPGQRCALNLSGVDHHQLDRGSVLVVDRQWRPTRRCDASLVVLGSLLHDLGSRGNYMMYIGSGEFPVALRIIGGTSISAGHRGIVRLRWSADIPILPHDRFILRETGRDETVGGGEVIDIDPQTPISRAAPDFSVDRVIAERGWISAHELELLTGEIVAPTVGDWIVSPSELKSTIRTIKQRIGEAGNLGVELASLSAHEQVIVGLIPDTEVVTGRVFTADQDGIANHPYVDQFLRAGFSPPSQHELDGAIIRQLVQRKILINCNGTVFHGQAILRAREAVRALLHIHPQGFTVSQFRDALNITRKYAIPLIEYLDQQGFTRRSDDLRLGGTKL